MALLYGGAHLCSTAKNGGFRPGQYTGLNASSRAHVQAYFAGLEAECASYGDETYVIPQIGLSMTTGGIHGGYDAAVASGAMDEQVWDGSISHQLGASLRHSRRLKLVFRRSGGWLTACATP